MPRYNDNFQCKGCGVEVTAELLDCVMDLECQACGGRIWVKTHRHRVPQTVDDERLISPVKFLEKKHTGPCWRQGSVDCGC